MKYSCEVRAEGPNIGILEVLIDNVVSIFEWNIRAGDVYLRTVALLTVTIAPACYVAANELLRLLFYHFDRLFSKA
jgi:hypothetical protein